MKSSQGKAARCGKALYETVFPSAGNIFIKDGEWCSELDFLLALSDLAALGHFSQRERQGGSHGTPKWRGKGCLRSDWQLGTVKLAIDTGYAE